MSSLDPALIAKLLKEEAEAPTRTGGGGRGRGKADLTRVRDLLTWNKLNHHICNNTCVHRSEGDNPTIPRNEAGEPTGIGHSCWNVECVDPRSKEPNEKGEFDRGTQIVCQVKGVYMCRYCYLNKWLLDE